MKVLGRLSLTGNFHFYVDIITLNGEKSQKVVDLRFEA
jgi:hypothetical protein